MMLPRYILPKDSRKEALVELKKESQLPRVDGQCASTIIPEHGMLSGANLHKSNLTYELFHRVILMSLVATTIIGGMGAK